MKKFENNFLYLVVLGGRAEKANIELHDVRWVVGSKKKHKDDISSLEKLISSDDCELIKNIGNWEIELTPDNKFVEENNYPDWFGYQKIDRK